MLQMDGKLGNRSKYKKFKDLLLLAGVVVLQRTTRIVVCYVCFKYCNTDKKKEKMNKKKCVPHVQHAYFSLFHQSNS